MLSIISLMACLEGGYGRGLARRGRVLRAYNDEERSITLEQDTGTRL